MKWEVYGDGKKTIVYEDKICTEEVCRDATPEMVTLFLEESRQRGYRIVPVRDTDER